MGLSRQCSERHGTSNEVLDDALLALYLVDIYGVTLEVEEVADEYRLILLVGHSRVFLEEIVVALAGSELQGGDGLRVPRVLDAVATPVELS